VVYTPHLALKGLTKKWNKELQIEKCYWDSMPSISVSATFCEAVASITAWIPMITKEAPEIQFNSYINNNNIIFASIMSI